jgi:hypothetical protein
MVSWDGSMPEEGINSTWFTSDPNHILDIYPATLLLPTAVSMAAKYRKCHNPKTPAALSANVRLTVLLRNYSFFDVRYDMSLQRNYTTPRVWSPLPTTPSVLYAVTGPLCPLSTVSHVLAVSFVQSYSLQRWLFLDQFLWETDEVVELEQHNSAAENHE